MGAELVGPVGPLCPFGACGGVWDWAAALPATRIDSSTAGTSSRRRAIKPSTLLRRWPRRVLDHYIPTRRTPGPLLATPDSPRAATTMGRLYVGSPTPARHWGKA